MGQIFYASAYDNGDMKDSDGNYFVGEDVRLFNKLKLIFKNELNKLKIENQK